MMNSENGFHYLKEAYREDNSKEISREYIMGIIYAVADCRKFYCDEKDYRICLF